MCVKSNLHLVVVSPPCPAEGYENNDIKHQKKGDVDAVILKAMWMNWRTRCAFVPCLPPGRSPSFWFREFLLSFDPTGSTRRIYMYTTTRSDLLLVLSNSGQDPLGVVARVHISPRTSILGVVVHRVGRLLVCRVMLLSDDRSRKRETFRHTHKHPIPQLTLPTVQSKQVSKHTPATPAPPWRPRTHTTSAWGGRRSGPSPPRAAGRRSAPTRPRAGP